MNLDDFDRDELIRLFFEESEEGLETMEEALVILETSPQDHGVLATLFRVAHTLKGNAGSLGFDDLAQVTHHLEDVLDRLRSGSLEVSRDVVDVLLASVDVLRGMLAEVKA
jgi:two-component system chemotaxis sensor kinase CheA